MPVLAAFVVATGLFGMVFGRPFGGALLVTGPVMYFAVPEWRRRRRSRRGSG